MMQFRPKLPDRRSLLGGGLGLGASLLLGKTRPDERPNILVICSDQQHWQAMGYMDPFFETPNCDRLAERSLNLTQAFCPTPQCSPSRAAMMTGFYPHKTGVNNNHGLPGDEGLKLPTLGHHMQQAGYYTAYHGKWHLGTTALATAGWDSFRMTRQHTDRQVTRMTRRFFSRASKLEKPFCLFAMYLEPHGIQEFAVDPGAKLALDAPLGESWRKETFENKPAVQTQIREQKGASKLAGQPEEAWKQYRVAYRERVRRFDAEVGKVLKLLEDNGLSNNTIVVVTSDHGEMDTFHRLIFKGPFMYEHVMRIPMLVHVPESMGGRTGVLDDYAWVNMDLLPTLMDIAGAEVPKCDGRSMLPILRGEEQAPLPFVIGQYYGKGQWIHPVRMIRTARYKYTRDHKGDEELYDLQQDPHELTNLAGLETHAQTRSQLDTRLRTWMKENEDPFESFAK